MNPNQNGNLLNADLFEGETVRPVHSETSAQSTPFSEAQEASPVWPTRADAVKTAATSHKPILLLGGGLAAAIALFAITSFVGKAPHKIAPPQIGTENASSAKPKGSITPLMDAVKNPTQSNSAGQLTAADINRTKASTGSQPTQASSQTSSRGTASTGTTLASVPPFESTQQHWEEPRPYGETPATSQPATSGAQQNLLKEASLVFVKKSEPNMTNSVSGGANSADLAPELNLTPGTRIQATLETQASSAVSAPVVAVVEYTYALGDQVVIPAGARVYGQLQQADRSGAVSIKFNELELLDGNREKIEAIGTSLELGPIKGSVSGKNTGKNFLVRTASGIGSVAAMLVGNNTSTAFSEDDLIRERIAQNAGNAGDTEIMNMAVTGHIVVSVPADTPIYIVFTKREAAVATSHQTTKATP
jgi:Type IV secretory pathway, VirB10 components